MVLEYSLTMEQETRTSSNNYYPRQVEIVENFHARPSASFSKLAKRYDAEVKVSLLNNPKKQVDGKSIIGLITLEAYAGKILIIKTRDIQGSRDAEECIDVLVKHVENGCPDLKE